MLLKENAVHKYRLPVPARPAGSEVISVGRLTMKIACDRVLDDRGAINDFP